MSPPGPVSPPGPRWVGHQFCPSPGPWSGGSFVEPFPITRGFVVGPRWSGDVEGAGSRVRRAAALPPRSLKGLTGPGEPGGLAPTLCPILGIPLC